MTHRLDVADSRDIVARWCNLAEQRLEYLTELFETGRWRRFHSELAFLENIQEAKTAVETWRSLSARGAALDHSALNMAWLGHTQTTLPRVERVRDPLDRLPPPQVEIAAELMPLEVSMPDEPEQVVSEEAPSALAETSPLDDRHRPSPDAIAQRYPLLRNAL
ncbi:TIGR03809 family protein [Bradyrhizobium sp.]|uniref:TIGR03809 family protein n=1 Tax=Bradyrhizobium sp. TaxID=376 RepID=UPI000A973A4E|nr:TIGR03809 family protein [Bradyrhizobium sp.]